MEGTPTRLSATAEDDKSFMPFMLMDNLLEKLKILNYDEEFIKSLKMRPINRHYFAIQSNPGEQFFMFVSLAAWMIRKIGMNFEQPQEDDDPNSTIASILEALRSMNIPIDFSPSKLKRGSGWYTLQCLTNLADKVMEKENFIYQKKEWDQLLRQCRTCGLNLKLTDTPENSLCLPPMFT